MKSRGWAGAGDAEAAAAAAAEEGSIKPVSKTPSAKIHPSLLAFIRGSAAFVYICAVRGACLRECVLRCVCEWT